MSVLCVVLALFRVHGRDLYVSTNGTSEGPGTKTQPYDLATALSVEVGQPGDTFWLRGGDYVIGHVETRIEGAPGNPITFRQAPGERARVDGALAFWGSMGHVILRDFELYSSDTNRLSAQTDAGINPPPTDINPVIGIASFVPNLSLINLVVHDHTRSGIYISEISTNTLVYGCVVYNNGWASPDNAEGHNLYVQSHLGTRDIADNVMFNATGANYHIYESRGGGQLTGVTLEGNVAFHAGALQQVRRYQDWIIGVDPPAISADRIVLRENMSYLPPGSSALEAVQVGRFGINGGVALLDNYFPQSVAFNNWTVAAVAGNTFGGPSGDHVVILNQTETPLAAAWDGNHYSGSTGGKEFMANSDEYDFDDWKSAMGFDVNSTYSVGNPAGTEVFVRPNRQEAGRANIIVYNWDNLDEVTVDAGSVLAPGAAYEVRNAQDYFAPPVLSGVFDGEPLTLPMTGLTVAAPNGPLLTPPATGPTFNVFILLPRLVRLHIEPVGGNMELSWPTNAGDWVLQFTAGGDWMDDTNTAAVLGARFVVTNSVTGKEKYYRLRSP